LSVLNVPLFYTHLLRGKTMKKKILLIGLLAAALTFGMTFVGCDDDSSGGGGGGGGGDGGGSGGSSGVGIQMVSIPAGTFMMSSPSSEPGHQGDETPQHSVTLTTGFKMSKYEVTQKQYRAVMGDSEDRTISAYGKGDNYPIYRIHWYDAIVFCNKLSMKEGLNPVYSIGGKTDPADWGAIPADDDATWDAVVMDKNKKGYRLPTEAEWEYACRGIYADKATKTNTLPFGIGTGRKMVKDMANFFVYNPYDLDHTPPGEYDGSTTGQLYKTAVVGSYEANNYGLYDMHGNSSEWCWDFYDTTYYASSPASDPTGPATGTTRVFRGGGYAAAGREVRSAFRSGSVPSYRTGNMGIRLVRTE
jgi:formylglycine-generating enzyme